MTQTIESLQSRIAELEAQADPEALHISYLHGQADKNQAIVELRKQLAASQLSEKRLREALRDTYVELFHCDQQMTHTYDEDGEPMWHTGSTVTMALEGSKELLDKPTSTEALDAYVAERVKVATLSIADQLQQERLQSITDFGQYQETYEQIATITRQRDLAVEALERIPEVEWWEDARSIVEQVLSTIKGSKNNQAS